jgi:hypothetical protein
MAAASSQDAAAVFDPLRPALIRVAYMRRRGIENASKEPSAVNPAMDQNTMRNA